MMKSTFTKSMLAAMGVTLAAASTSCTNDTDLLGQRPDGYVTFRAELPEGLNTRAFADGLSAVNLQYVVYDKEGTTKLFDGVKTLEDKTTEVQIPLVTGESYQILFYADSFGKDNSASPYTFNQNLGTLTVDYSKVSTNSDAYDAFFKKEVVEGVTAGMTRTVVLTRPFAQVNIATSDLEHANQLGIFPGSAAVVTLPVYTELDMIDGTVDGLVETEVTFADFAIEEGETITVEGVKYDNLAMLYVLGDENPNLLSKVDMTLTPKAGTQAIADATKSYTSIPYKRNFRTNIVGKLLTSNTNWSVIIDNSFIDDLWMGQTQDPTAESENVYVIENAAQLAGLAKMVNSGNSFIHKTVKLAADIDLNNVAWTPIGAAKTTPFKGSFDGQGHVVTNLNVKADEYAGLFGYVCAGIENGSCYEGTYFKNLTVKNANVQGAHFVGVIAGQIANWWTDITGCVVENATVTGYVAQVGDELENANKVGGFIGHLQTMTCNVNNNRVSNVTVSAIRDCGGFTGALTFGAGNKMPGRDKSYVTDNSVENVSIYIIPDAANNNFGEFIGRNQTSTDNTIVEPNTVNNVTIATFLAEGVEMATDGTVNITSAKGLINFSGLVAGGNTFYGKTVCLTSDIDLEGVNWQPIGANADSANKFKGTFDGQGHTISNLKYVTSTATYSAAGFFGALNGIAKNLVFENAQVEHVSLGPYTDNGVAVVAGSIYTSGSIENVTVRNSSVKGNRYTAAVAGYVYGNIINCIVENTDIVAAPDFLTGEWDNGDKVGALGGYVAEEQGLMTGNTVSKVNITGYRHVGGLAGYYNHGINKVLNNAVSDVTINCDNSHNYKGFTANSQYGLNAFFGVCPGSCDASNTSSNVTINYPISE